MRHDITLAPPPELANPAATPANRLAPAILQRSDADFIPAVLEALRSEAGRRGLLASRAAARQAKTGALKLFQPVQRQFHVAVFEAYCDRPGRPRLDPARVAAAGLVVRRLRRDGRGVRYYEGWMRMRGRLRGWLKIERLGGEAADPAAGFRLARAATGVADIDDALRRLDANAESSVLEEHVVPMFVAPPDVCAAAGKTLFYGVVPTTSGEIAEGPVSLDQALGDSAQPFGPADAEFRNHLVECLRGEAMDFALAGEPLHPGWYEAVEMAGEDKPEGLSGAHWDALRNPLGGDALAMRRFIAALRQLTVEFDLFGDTPEAKQLRAVLAEIRLPLKRHEGEAQRYVRADEFMGQAKAVLLERAAGAARPEMPERWPALPAELRDRLLGRLSAAVQRRFADTKGAPGRYDEPGAQYAIRAFVREKPTALCPGRVHWSDYSEPFVIAPWYEGSGAPPTQVVLPDLGDLKSLKPNVAFVVPPSLQGLLGGNPKDMLGGKGKTGEGGIAWICSFSLPVITICAFIVLNIFLSLFDLIFRWLFFIKICIPFPKKGD